MEKDICLHPDLGTIIILIIDGGITFDACSSLNYERRKVDL